MRTRRRAAATAVLLIALVLGGAFALGRSPDSSGRAARAVDEQTSVIQPTSTLPGTIPIREVQGWPHTGQNPAGTYSWDGHACAGGWCTQGPSGGFMHNGYGAGDVEIWVERASKARVPDKGAEAVTIAGHDGLYRRTLHRTGARTEEWVVGIQGKTLVIRLEAKPGASDANLAEAHAIIDSMGTQTRDTKLGFRLVFTIKTNVWDSG